MAAFAKQGVPQAADLGRVSAAPAVGASADGAGAASAAAALLLVSGHAFEAEEDRRRRVVQVPEVGDRVAGAAGADNAPPLDSLPRRERGGPVTRNINPSSGVAR